MKRIITLYFAVISAFSSYSQTYIQDGDHCFDSGDYDCAITNYNEAFKLASGKDKQVAEIKLTRAKWCAEHIKTADQAFVTKNYSTAKEEYQKVLNSNPKDNHSQLLIVKCDNALNPPKLRKATAADLEDIWNNKYGVNPQRRQNLINAGIDPDYAQRRINAGEGKPQEKEKQATYLFVLKSALYFNSYGETSELIKVNSDVSNYSFDHVPSWCTVKKYYGYFTVTASANPNYRKRKDWFKVTAGGKEVRIYVEQSARNKSNSQQSSSPKKKSTQSNSERCFNCPKTRDTWGLTLGYAQQTIDYYYMDVVLFGLKAEPLFKFGFGLNTGINLLGYSVRSFDSQFFENGCYAYAVNIPLHIEYRLNFSKWFNIFTYGGVGLNAITDPSFDNFSLPVTFEYGGGIRINHVQFNIGLSLYLGNLRNTQDFGKYTGTSQTFSVSYLF